MVVAAVAAAVSVEFRPGIKTVLAEPQSATIPSPLRLAYIYKNDKESADNFRHLLEDNDCFVQEIQLDAVAEIDFRSFAAILIGSDTKRAWAGLAKAVDVANKPILGLGEGGYDFFGDLKLAIGARHGWHGNERGLLPVNHPRSRLWSYSKAPSKLGFVTVYETTNHVGIYAPKPADDVLLLGREEKNADHYPLLQQGSHYVLWGFTASPNQMTRAGKDLFIATCRYTADLKESSSGEAPAEDVVDPFRKRSTSKAP